MFKLSRQKIRRINSLQGLFYRDYRSFLWQRKKAYLSAVKDLDTKEIVGHYFSWNIDMELEFNILAKTIEITPVASLEFLIIHSDQGFHYINPIFIQKLKDLKITQSM